jgi:Sec-independent protein translocase protein TatA
MESDKATLLVCLVVVLALALPAALYAAYKDAGRWVKLTGRAVRRARNPWEGEERNLEELSELVKQFKPAREQEVDDNQGWELHRGDGGR